jgi:hypothetical protein
MRIALRVAAPARLFWLLSPRVAGCRLIAPGARYVIVFHELQVLRR